MGQVDIVPGTKRKKPKPLPPMRKEGLDNINSSLEGTTWIATVYWFASSLNGEPTSNRVIAVSKIEFKFLRGGKFEGGYNRYFASRTHTQIDGTWI